MKTETRPGIEPENSEPRSMTEQETLAFLQEQGVKPLPLGEWKPHQPILYVLEDRIKDHFDDMAAEQKPSIVRLDDPVELDLKHPETGKLTEVTTYYFGNAGGRVDYYAIDSKTKERKIVKTSYTDSEKDNRGYRIKAENFFNTANELFSPGKESV